MHVSQVLYYSPRCYLLLFMYLKLHPKLQKLKAEALNPGFHHQNSLLPHNLFLLRQGLIGSGSFSRWWWPWDSDPSTSPPKCHRHTPPYLVDTVLVMIQGFLSAVQALCQLSYIPSAVSRLFRPNRISFKMKDSCEVLLHSIQTRYCHIWASLKLDGRI